MCFLGFLGLAFTFGLYGSVELMLHSLRLSKEIFLTFVLARLTLIIMNVGKDGL